MLDMLGNIDQALFLLINTTLANPITDWIMPLVTSNDLLRIGYAVAMALILWRGDRRLRWMVLFSILVLVMTDQTSSQFLKKLIERPRPCHVLENINLLVGCGGGYAMPSSHAANAFGQAILFSLAVPKIRLYLIGLATIVAFSRVFVGVHYPFDVMVGAIVGTLLGWLGYWFFVTFKSRFIDSAGESHAV